MTRPLAAAAPRAAALAVGLFSTVAQTVLLREFLVVFRGSELAIGLAWAAWFGWIAVAAAIVARVPGLAAAAGRRAGLLLAAWPLVTIAGWAVLAGLRSMLGVAAYAPVPPAGLVAGAVLATLPCGLLTGLLFPVACDLLAKTAEPVTASESEGKPSPAPDFPGLDGARGAIRGYPIEAVGALIGGLGGTLALYLGAGGLHLLAGAGLASVAAGTSLRADPGGHGPRSRAAFAPAVVAALVLLAFVVPPTSGWLRAQVSALRLAANLDEDGARIDAEIETPYQLVTTVRRPDQALVLSNGAVEAAFPSGPDEEAAAALLACQPARRGRAVLYGQSRPGLAETLAQYFERVDVVALDGQALASQQAASASAGGAPASAARVHAAIEDPRTAVQGCTPDADLAVIAAPEPSTLYAGRLYTREFLEGVSGCLAPGGVATAQFRSADNYAGPALRRYGQSVVGTFAAVFPDVRVVPGVQATVLASPATGRTTADPAVLASRYAAFAPSPAPYPARAFASLVQPDREALARELYDPARIPADLVGSDARPVATYLHLGSDLALAGLPALAEGLESLRSAGPTVFVVVLVLGFLVALRGRVRSRGSRPSGGTLLATAGAASCAASVALLALYQARVGAVFGEIGAATALSMAGLAAGAALGGRLSRGLADQGRARAGVMAALAGAVPGIVLLAAVPTIVAFADGASPFATRALFWSLFAACGGVTGLAWPLAARLSGDGRTAARLAAVDYAGACVAALAGGVIVLPIAGPGFLLGLSALALGGAAVVTLADAFLASDRGARLLATRAGAAFAGGSLPRVAGSGLLLFAILAPLVVWHLARPPAAGPISRLDPDLVRRIDPATGVACRDDPIPHCTLAGATDPPGDGVSLATAAADPGAAGWGGPLNLYLSATPEGRVRRVAVLESSETPAYVQGLPRFLDGLRDHRLGEPFAIGATVGLDAMTGATVTRDAVLRTLDRAGARLAADVLHLDVPAPPPHPAWTDALASPELIWVLLLVVAVALVHRLASGRARLLFLGFVLVGGGVFLNVQLSTAWLVSLARMDLPAWDANPALLVLTVAVLVGALVQGPVWCAHACPFGAAQELIGRAAGRFRPLSPLPAGAPGRALRAVRFLVLALVVLAALSDEPSSRLSWDPLATVFSGVAAHTPWIVLVLVAVASLEYFRPWCRLFCPVGAFLHLGNRTAALLGLVPARAFGRCDLGVEGPHDLACLQCNRCVRDRTFVPQPQSDPARRLAAIATVVAVATVLAFLVRGVVAPAPGSSPAGGLAGSSVAPAPEVRTVGSDTIRALIRDGKLSDREALFWKR